jgi:guanyl-specific ribonuclease Sa
MNVRFVAVLAAMLLAALINPTHSCASSVNHGTTLYKGVPAIPDVPKPPTNSGVQPNEVSFTRSSLPQTRAEWLTHLASGPFEWKRRSVDVVLARYNKTYYEIRIRNPHLLRAIFQI